MKIFFGTGIQRINLFKILGGFMKKKSEKLFRIRIKDRPEVKNHPDLQKFAGWVRIAKLTTAGLFLFTFTASSGFSGLITETHTIAPNLVDIIS